PGPEGVGATKGSRFYTSLSGGRIKWESRIWSRSMFGLALQWCPPAPWQSPAYCQMRMGHGMLSMGVITFGGPVRKRLASRAEEVACDPCAKTRDALLLGR